MKWRNEICHALYVIIIRRVDITNDNYVAKQVRLCQEHWFREEIPSDGSRPSVAPSIFQYNKDKVMKTEMKATKASRV
jgi:hypothetical protein